VGLDPSKWSAWAVFGRQLADVGNPSIVSEWCVIEEISGKFPFSDHSTFAE
jgi:hypothetical protein